MIRILIISTIILSCTHVYTQDFKIVAGESLDIDLSDNGLNGATIIVNGNYGATLIEQNKNGTWTMPAVITQSKGHYEWSIDDTHRGVITVTAQTIPHKLEQYYGPIKIIVEDNETAEILTIVTDSFDNIIPNTNVNIQGHSTESILPLEGENLISYHSAEVTSRGSAGKQIISTRVDQSSTSEKEIQVVNRKIAPFSIEIDQQSDYADGHQLLKFSTNDIHYVDGPTVVDGTLVGFYIESSENKQLYTQGITVNGIAEAYIRHPIIPTKWTIKGMIAGYVMSNSVDFRFHDYIQDFPVSWNGEIITVGPVKGPQGQNVHNGTPVQFTFHSAGDENNTSVQLKDGKAILVKDDINIKTKSITIRIGKYTKKVKLTDE